MTAISSLRRRMIEDMTVRNLSLATLRSYGHAVAKFGRSFGRSPKRFGLEDVHNLSSSFGRWRHILAGAGAVVNGGRSLISTKTVMLRARLGSRRMRPARSSESTMPWTDGGGNAEMLLQIGFGRRAVHHQRRGVDEGQRLTLFVGEAA